ncbi:hypothetical protein FHS29_000528 [Saccharothrix tamanrassetensis]|uniref:Uncharacterized protein n=1 Tax=Saccharothrix tamanrassetensis TaxID=1051531 RepID=A0A841CCQ7_9PSEU|nr:hypothetical protein [Saccharothrix tamanrassetensis]MBB5953958.1 hypothetical protein [Saccharothrix tamanrassetensis]
MPDWTYQPLRGVAAALLGVRRSQVLALRALATVGRLPGGGWAVARALGHRHPPAHLAGTVDGVPVRSRLGAVVPPEVARDAVRALPLLGAGVIEVAPATEADVVRQAVAGAPVPVLVREADPAEEEAIVRDAGAVVPGRTDVVHLTSPDIPAAVEALADPDAIVLATPSVLIDAGPGWFGRVLEAATPTTPPARTTGWNPRWWPTWWWGALVGLGMVAGGLVAAAITLGPVLLWYDRAFLGASVDHLHHINHRLVGFLQHDRITLAGTMVSIGVLYTGLSVGGLRRGWPWAREAYLVSGWIGFPTLLYFVGSGFLEPLHVAAAAALFPAFLLSARRRDLTPQWTSAPEGDERVRRRALVGQLLVVITGAGLFVGGVVVSVVGLTEVFVPSDLEFLGAEPAGLADANPKLLAFIAHDRAGFGGALMSAAAAITLLGAWGWRRGEAWVWWSLALAAVTGFLPAVVVHGVIHYIDFGHLAPVFVGMATTVTALALARPYLCARLR